MKCLSCERKLNNPADPFSEDCGGECLQCMADAGDPECVRHVDRIKAEQRCMELSSDLLRAATDQSKPIDRGLAIGVAECVAYLLSRLKETK